MKRVFLVGMLGLVASSGAGCSLAPRSFRDMLHPAPVVRARAMDLEKDQPESVAVPAMIARLNDPDRAVRITASEDLKRRTGQDMGFVPWGSPEARVAGARKWESWWKDRQAQAGFPKDDQLARVANRPAKARRKRRSTAQEGPPTSWPAPSPTPSGTPAVAQPPRPASLPALPSP